MENRIMVLEKLYARIKRNELEDEDDLLLYMALASRMKALGEDAPFENLFQIVQKPEFAGKVDDVLKEGCERGIWDVRERMGEELGFVLITAQDFWLLYHYASGKLFSDALNPLFEEWAHETSMVEIDEETREVIESFKETYDLPEALLLPVMDTPVTETEYELIGQIADHLPPREVIEIPKVEVSVDVYAAQTIEDVTVLYRPNFEGKEIRIKILDPDLLAIEYFDKIRLGIFPATWDEESQVWRIKYFNLEDPGKEKIFNVGPLVLDIGNRRYQIV